MYELERNKGALTMKEYERLPYMVTTFTPAAYISNPHVDGASYSHMYVHFLGEKIWLYWPPTSNSMAVLGLNYPGATSPNTTPQFIQEMEGLEVSLSCNILGA
jgi:hypothetical protein